MAKKLMAPSAEVAWLWHGSRTIEYDGECGSPCGRPPGPLRVTDAALIDAALEALLARHRAAEVDASYAAYDKHPIDERDEWGDLTSFRQAAAANDPSSTSLGRRVLSHQIVDT